MIFFKLKVMQSQARFINGQHGNLRERNSNGNNTLNKTTNHRDRVSMQNLGYNQNQIIDGNYDASIIQSEYQTNQSAYMAPQGNISSRMIPNSNRAINNYGNNLNQQNYMTHQPNNFRRQEPPASSNRYNNSYANNNFNSNINHNTIGKKPSKSPLKRKKSNNCCFLRSSYI